MSLPADPFGRIAAPSGLSRADRVRYTAEAAKILLDSGTSAGLFVGAVVSRFLFEGRTGELEAMLGIHERGNHLTAAKLAASLIADEDKGNEDGNDAAISYSAPDS